MGFFIHCMLWSLKRFKTCWRRKLKLRLINNSILFLKFTSQHCTFISLRYCLYRQKCISLKHSVYTYSLGLWPTCYEFEHSRIFFLICKFWFSHKRNSFFHFQFENFSRTLYFMLYIVYKFGLVCKLLPKVLGPLSLNRN